MITVLLTGVGCPGAATVIRLLRENGERKVKLVGTDMRDWAQGQHFVDKFYMVPSGNDTAFIPAIQAIVEQERVDVVLPQSSDELKAFAYERDNLGVPVLVSARDPTLNTVKKASLYQFVDYLNMQYSCQIPMAKWAACRDKAQFVEAIGHLGFPNCAVCHKPDEGTGGRGFGILRTPIDLANALEKLDIGPLKSQVVMELLGEKRLYANVLCHNGQVLTGYVMEVRGVREGERNAVAFRTVDEPSILAHVGQLVKYLKLDWFANVQFMGGKLMEINPRISTQISDGQFNMPWLAVKLALGLITEDVVRQMHLEVGKSAVRYYDEVFYQ